MADTGTTILMMSQWKDMQMQFQIYQISAIILFFVIIAIFVLFKDAFPFMWARFVTHDIVVGIVDKTTGVIQLNKEFKKRNGVFYYKGEPLPFVKVYKGNFLFAGRPMDIVDIDLRTITDPRYKKACKTLQNWGYRDINALEKAILFSMMNADDPRVEDIIAREGYGSYEEAKAAINPKGLTVEHKIVQLFFTSIPLSEMLGYGTEVPSASILGEVDDITEARKPQMQFRRDMSKIAPLAVLIVAVGAAAAVAYMVFFK